MEVLQPVAAQSRFEKYVDFCKPGKTPADSWIRTTISKAQAEAYLSSEECRKLPKLTGILHFPPLVEKDRQLRLLGNGYDEETGYFVDGAHEPEEMTLEQAVGRNANPTLFFQNLADGCVNLVSSREVAVAKTRRWCEGESGKE